MKEAASLPIEDRIELTRRLDVAKGVAEVIRKRSTDLIRLDKYPRHIALYAKFTHIYMLAGVLAVIVSYYYQLEYIGISLVLFVMAIEGYQYQRGLRITNAILSMEINLLLKDWIAAGHSPSAFDQLKLMSKVDGNDYGFGHEWTAWWDELEKNAIRRFSEI